jgi:diguanylate cyclase (GGDEF)-like protein/PAS domain S-box-containing protein
VGGSALFIASALGLADLYAGADGPVAGSLAQALGYLVAGSAALVMASRATPAGRPPLAMAGGALSALALAGGALAYLELDRPAGGVAWLCVGWPIGWLLLAYAARSRGPAAGPAAPQWNLQPGLPTQASVFVPSVPFAAALAVGTLEAARGEFSRFEIWTAGAVVLLVVIRQGLALLENISFWRRLEAKVNARAEQLRRGEARFRSLVQNASDVITLVAPDGAVRYQSPSVQTVFGYEPQEVDGIAPVELVHPEDLGRALAAVRELKDRPAGTQSLQCRIRHADGGWRHAETVISNLLHDEAVAAFVLNTRDITERKEGERLTHQAFHDALTNLPNRALFADRLAHAIERTSRTESGIAVLFLDLDDFKDVNDTFGHIVGDELLGGVAERLQACARAADTVARFGGDEFAALIEGVTDRGMVTEIGQRMLAALDAPFDLRGRRIFVGGSMGIAVWPEAGETPEDLVHNADLAMYAAKAAGKGTVQVFEPDVDAVA